MLLNYRWSKHIKVAFLWCREYCPFGTSVRLCEHFNTVCKTGKSPLWSSKWALFQQKWLTLQPLTAFQNSSDEIIPHRHRLAPPTGLENSGKRGWTGWLALTAPFKFSWLNLFADISSPALTVWGWSRILIVLQHIDKSHPPLVWIILNHFLLSSWTPLSGPYIHPRWVPWLSPSSLWYMCSWFFRCHLDADDPCNPPPPTHRRAEWMDKQKQAASQWLLITFGLCLWVPAQHWCWSLRLPAFQESQHSKYSAHPKSCCLLPWRLSLLSSPMSRNIFQLHWQLCIISCVWIVCECVHWCVCVCVHAFL